jgi:hypothetical protein
VSPQRRCRPQHTLAVLRCAKRGASSIVPAGLGPAVLPKPPGARRAASIAAPRHRTQNTHREALPAGPALSNPPHSESGTTGTTRIDEPRHGSFRWVRPQPYSSMGARRGLSAEHPGCAYEDPQSRARRSRDLSVAGCNLSTLLRQQTKRAASLSVPGANGLQITPTPTPTPTNPNRVPDDKQESRLPAPISKRQQYTAHTIASRLRRPVSLARRASRRLQIPVRTRLAQLRETPARLLAQRR